ncbi:heterokaryon incompatibility protein-domain-containing protein [Lasiosphaeria hispida]|uniref:Heterokaryon incompatibility protein-domain-containing protein n=1 Tax=Lasiosphaeria hispida TaxID=260671 RepID=A0AAJ0HS75_9PEZI|nr:heterokaryon incompatibility protein-domain-containing protein [Lasiosphaeria hispida]
MARLHLIILSEFVVVILVWDRALFALFRLIFQVRQTLPDIWRDTSVELRMLASSMSLMLEVHLRRMLQDLFQGIGFREEHSRTWSNCIHAVLTAFFATLRRSPISGSRWLRHQVLDGLLDHLLNPRQGRRARLRSPDASLPGYKYKRLSGSRAIRLITLTPHNAKDEVPITCAMEEVPLTCAPSFTALSYAWDSEDGNEQIICDGALITVTKNCVAALRNIREDSTRTERRLWVDAICINQAATATAEKNQQISIMGDIYKTAANVRVWLGEQDDSSSLVCNYFAKVSGVDDETLAWKDSEHDARKVGLDMARTWPHLSKSMADFFRRSWFTRAWPVQEVTLPQPGRVTVVCGGAHLTLEYIRLGWNVLRELDVLPASANLDQAVALQFYLADAIALKRGLAVKRGLNPPRLYANLNTEKDSDFDKPLLKDLSEFSFTSVMNSMRFKACRDPKDRFFSLYGVFQELEVDHDIPISMWAQTDAQVIKAVAQACFKLDGNLDAIRLAQLPDPYLRLSDNLLISARRNPYDGLSTSIFAMTGRVLGVATNVIARRDVCYNPANDWLVDLPSWVPDWTQPISASIDPARHISLLDTFIPALLPPSPDKVRYNIDGQCLNVEAKILGLVTDIGTVDSVQLLWQVFSSTFIPRKGNLAPDPAISALTETAINLVWRSHMTQIFVSMRMAIRTLDIFDIMSYAGAAYTSSYFTTRSHRFLCTRFPSVASCPTDGHHMQLSRGWTVQPMTETQAISQAVQVFLKGRTWINRDMWRQSSGDILFTIGGVMWEFRVSLIETLFGTRYDEVEWTLVVPVLGHLISAAMQAAAVFIGDTALFLFAWSLGALANIGFMVAFVVWAWKILVLPVLVVLALRAYRSPAQFLSSIFRIARFRQPGAYSQGMHFFVTDTGITGSTSGPVASNDCLALIRGSAGHLVLRPSTNGYVVVGASYVGSRPGADEVVAKETWANIRVS